MVHQKQRHQLILLISLMAVQITYYYQLIFLSKPEKIPYQTSILSEEGWILELMNGHPDRIKTCLGVSHNVFNALVCSLEENGFVCLRHGISVAEQLGIFRYTCVTGLSLQHVGERFQHSPDTITRYFLCDLWAANTAIILNKTDTSRKCSISFHPPHSIQHTCDFQQGKHQS